jgi:hypothetical protein
LLSLLLSLLRRRRAAGVAVAAFASASFCRRHRNVLFSLQSSPLLSIATFLERLFFVSFPTAKQLERRRFSALPGKRERERGRESGRAGEGKSEEEMGTTLTSLREANVEF